MNAAKPFKGIPNESVIIRVCMGETLEVSKRWNVDIQRVIKQCWDMEPKRRPDASSVLNIFERLVQNRKAEVKKDPSMKKQSKVQILVNGENMDRILDSTKSFQFLKHA